MCGVSAQRPLRREAEAEEADAERSPTASTSCRCSSRLRRRLVQRLERRAGELELAAGLEADVAARRRRGASGAMMLPPSRIGSQPKRRSGLPSARGCRARPRRGRASGCRCGTRTSRARCRSANRPSAFRRPRSTRRGRRASARAAWRAFLAGRHGLGPAFWLQTRARRALPRWTVLTAGSLWLGLAARTSLDRYRLSAQVGDGYGLRYAVYAKGETRALHLRSRHRQSPNTALTRNEDRYRSRIGPHDAWAQ